MAHAAPPIEEHPQRTCFVTAPVGVSTTTIAQLLHQRNIRPVTIADRGATGGSLPEMSNEAIIKATLVIAVLGRKESNGNTFVELGAASALRKPILIITPPDSEAVPLSLAGLPQVATDPHDAEAIGFVLDQVLTSLQHPKRTHNFPARGSRPIDPVLARELLARLDHVPSASAVEEIVASAIAASGIDIIVREERGDQGADLGIWSDDLDAAIGNPLLIEVKADLRDRQQVFQLRSQLQHYLQATNARTALVLYLDGPKGIGDLLTLSLPNILFMPVRDLLEQLQSEGFGAAIGGLRDRVIQQVAA